MKALQGRWRQICKLSDAIFGRIEQSVPTAGRGCSSKAGNSVPEYAKLNLPKGRWQDRTQSDSWKTTSSSSQDWGSFAMKGAVGAVGVTGGMMLLYAHRSDLAGTAAQMSHHSMDLFETARHSIADIVRSGNGSPSTGNFLADAAAKAAPAVVNVTANLDHGKPLSWADKTCGSGFITDASGVIVTNAHVVDEAICKQQMTEGKWREKPLRVALQDGRRFEAKVIGMDRQSDVALIQIASPAALPTVKLGSSGALRMGEWVLALGSPLTLQNSVTAGIVSCTGRKAEELGLLGSSASFIQTDAAINTGNSGGPLLNMTGEVIGISCMRALNSNGVSFAIPIDSALSIMKQMDVGEGEVDRPYVGLHLLELDADTALQMSRRNSKLPILAAGVLVTAVNKGSPADKAGLRAGDIITGVEDRLGFLTASCLMDEFSRNIGKKMKLFVRRESEIVRPVITPGHVAQERRS